MRRRIFRRLAGDNGGATALEFAIISPVFIALAFGVFNMGLAVYCGAVVGRRVDD